LSPHYQAIGIVVHLTGHADLVEIVRALGACGGFAHFLYRRQQQADQHGDDGDDDEQLNKREAGPPVRHGSWHRSLVFSKNEQTLLLLSG
jgi:hypothetical protein